MTETPKPGPVRTPKPEDAAPTFAPGFGGFLMVLLIVGVVLAVLVGGTCLLTIR